MQSNEPRVLQPRARVLATLVLAAAALAGNELSVPMFFGVDLIFGSIAVMLAVVLVGTAPAVLVAAVGGLPTLALWNHPYALVILVAEALVVGLLYRRGMRNLVLADLAYWVAIGAPLVLVFYRSALGMGWQSAALIAIKQPLNGLFNALVAGLLVLAAAAGVPRLAAWLPTRFRLSEVLFHALLTLTLLAGAAPIITDAYAQRDVEEAFVAERLGGQADLVVREFDAGYGTTSATMAPLLGRLVDEDAGIGVVDADGRVRASAGRVASLTAADGVIDP